MKHMPEHIREQVIEDSDIKKRMIEIKNTLDSYEMEDRLAAFACYMADITPEQAKAIGIH